MNEKNYIMQCDLDGKNEQIIQINSSSCLFHNRVLFNDRKIDNMNNEGPLIYWLSNYHIFVTDINDSMCNMILHKENKSDNVQFQSMTIDKTNIYISASKASSHTKYIYVLKKKFASLKSVSNAYKYVEKITSLDEKF